MSAVPWSVAADGVLLAVRLTPKGGRDAIEGVEQLANGRMVLKARVRALPAGGKANAALVELLARTLRVPPSRVALVTGVAARVKQVKITGDGAALVAGLRAAIED